MLTAQLAPLTSVLTFPSRNTRHQDVPGCHPKANVHFIQERQIQTVWDGALYTGITFSWPLQVRGAQKAMQAEIDAHWLALQVSLPSFGLHRPVLADASFPLQEVAPSARLRHRCSHPCTSSILQTIPFEGNFSQNYASTVPADRQRTSAELPPAAHSISRGYSVETSRAQQKERGKRARAG